MRIIFLCILSLLFKLHSEAASAVDTLWFKEQELLARSNYIKDLDSSAYYARKILEKCKTNDAPHFHAFAFNWIGICFMKNGQVDSAEAYYQKVIEYGLSKDVLPSIQKARLNRSINFFQQGNFEKAAEYAQEAFVSFQKTGDSLGMAHALYNLANCLFRLDQFKEALTFYRDAENSYKQSPNSWSLANLYNAMGSVHIELAQLDSALFYFENSLEIKRSMGGENYCSSEYINIANIYTDINLIDSAFFYSYKARNLSDYVGDLPKLCTALLNLSRLHFDNLTNDSALYYAKEAFPISKEIKDDFLRYTAFLRLAKGFSGMGQSDSAFYYHVQYVSLRDSIKNIDIQEKTSRLEKQYQLAKKDRKLLILDMEIQQKAAHSRLQLGLIFILLLVVILLVVWFRIKRQQQRLKSRIAINEEHTRIAMDLHDHVGAELTLATSKLDTRMYKADRINDKKDLQNIADQLRNISTILRETVWSIRNESISVQELLNRVEKFTHRLLEESAFTYNGRSNCGNYNLSPQLALTLYRICQEGITNAFKHSKGNQLELVIELKNKMLYLQLTDDGSDFSNDQLLEGYGIRNMKDRAAKINGQLSIKTENSGTVLTLNVPLP